VAADYHINTYFRNERGVLVNLYLPSTLRWNWRGAHYSLQQASEYPYDSNIRFDLTASLPATFSIFLRIPAWAQGAALAVNGRRDSMKLAAGTFAEVRREWKTGDRIELELPLTTRLEAVDAQHPDVVALANGPLALMALLSGGLDSGFDAEQQHLTRAMLLSATRSTARGHEWTVGSGAETLRMRPFVDLGDEAYTTYLKVATG
jgi:DUF1680 family protein